MRTTASGLTVKRITAALGLVVLIALCAFPLLVDNDLYGKVPVPGSATVHLPAGDVDVTQCARRPDKGAQSIPVPPLSMRIYALDGSAEPKVIEARQSRTVGGSCGTQNRVWVVQASREGDYHVTVNGDVYDGYQPTLAFGYFIWNDVEIALFYVGAVLLVVVVVSVVAGLIVLVVALAAWLFRACRPGDKRSTDAPEAGALPSAPTVADVADSPPADLVLPYPTPRARVAGFVYFALGLDVLVGGPALAMYWWLTVPGPTHWPQVVVLGGMAVGFGYMFWRIASRWALIRARRARGDGWLRLTGKGFEVHERLGKPRQYAWSELEDFMLVESQDSEGGVSRHVGIRFVPEPKRADHAINGYWECSLEVAVDLMNDWLMRYRARDLGVD